MGWFSRCIKCDKQLMEDNVVLVGCYRRKDKWYCLDHLPGEKLSATLYDAGEYFVPPPAAEPRGIDRPEHYKASGKYRDYEVADDWGLPAILAQALKYIKRHRHKGKPVADLEKARDCITLHLEHIATEDAE